MQCKQLSALLLSAALMICAVQAEPLKIWCWDQNFNIPAVQLAAEKYRAVHPDFAVDIQEVANGDTVLRMKEALAKGDESTLPDVVLIDDYRAQEFIAREGFLKDLDALLDKQNFAPYKIAVGSDEQGHVYGVPFDSGVGTLFVRSDLFEQAGITPNELNSMSWERFIEMGVKVKEKTGHYLIPYDPGNLMELNLILQSGGEWYTKEDGVTVNVAHNPVLKAAFEVYRQMNDKGVLYAYEKWNWDAFMASFQEDKVAAVLSACWLTSSVMAAASQQGKWRIYRLPVLRLDSGTPYSNQGGSQWYVRAKSSQAEQAADFLVKTFGSDREFINELVPKINLISTMNEAELLSNYQVKNSFFGGQRVLKMMTKWSHGVPPVKYGSYSREVEGTLQEALAKYLAGAELQQVLNEAQLKSEERIAKLRGGD